VLASNLCVAPETEILTSRGYQPIWTLVGKKLEVWNGREWSKTTVKKTGENQKLIKIVTNSGQELECTEYHKFYVQKDYSKPAVETKALDLKVGDKLIKFNLPLIHGIKDLPFAYENGYYSGDGCHHKGKNILYFYGDKRGLIKHCELDSINYQDNQNRAVGYCKHLEHKFFVPGSNYKVGTRLLWLAGLLDADGTVARNGTNESLQVASVNKDFLKEVQLMLQTLGVQSKVTFTRKEGIYDLPANDGSGKSKKFKCKEINRLLISSTGLYKLSQLGLKCHRLQWEVREPQKCAEQFIKVTAIIDEGRYDDTYCFTEPKRHMGMFNGLLTGQCTEITLPSDEDHTFTCQPGFATLYTPGGNIISMDEVQIGTELWSQEGKTIVVNKVSSGVKPVYKYTTKHGSFIGTEDHRVIEKGEKVEVRYAQSIDKGNLPIPFTDRTLDWDVVLQGLLVGDGTFRNGENQLCVGEMDYDYASIPEISNRLIPIGHNYIMKVVEDALPPLPLTHQRELPGGILFSNSKKKISFLLGLFSANGSVRKTICSNDYIVLKQSSKKLIEQVQELLYSLGIRSGIYLQKGKMTKFDNGEYNCKDSYHLIITEQKSVITYNNSIGFLQKYKKAEIRKKAISKARKSSNIISVEYLGNHEVYHIEVDNPSHTYITGGLNVSNCVLSSMNLAKYDEWKDTDAVFWATVFLDCVAQDFITKGSKIKGLEKAVRFTEKSRALGLGTLGFHTYLQQNNIAIESLEAHFKNLEIYKHLHDGSLRASEWMAKELGEPEWCKGYGVRNSHRTAIAPNTSSALLCGSVSQGIEPVYQNVYTQGSASGDMYRINPVLLDIMKTKGVYNKKVLEDIASKQGSVQHVDWLDDHQKLVFKTAFEVDQKTLIRLASTRQQYICQAQSLNLFFNADEEEQYIMEVHKEAFLDPNILSLYYMRSLAGVQTSKECLRQCFVGFL